MSNRLKMPYNYDNFCKLQNEVQELMDLTTKLSARLALAEAPVASKKPVKKAKAKE